MLTKQKLRTCISYVFSRVPDFRGKIRVTYALNRLILPHSGLDCIIPIEMKLGYRMMVDLRSVTESLTAYTRDYDTEEISSCLRLLHANSVVLDVGANVGFWTVPMALGLGAEGRVHAFEPLPSNATRLRENVSLNGMEHVVRVHEIGLSDQPATLEISLREDFARGSQTGNAAIVIDKNDRKFECTAIQVDTLDRVLDLLDIQRLDLVKIDIEGHEDKFLAGARSAISRFRPILFIEINEPYYKRRRIDVDGLFESWLHTFQYVCALRSDHGWNIGELRSRKPALDNLLFLPGERVSEIYPLLT